MSQASFTSTTSFKPFQSSSMNADQSTSSAHSTGAQDSRETTHYVKQSLLDAKVISCLAPWIMCGIHDIQANVLKIIRYLQHSKIRFLGSRTSQSLCAERGMGRKSSFIPNISKQHT
ncbi:hypothetical protein OS493_009669 [Desmophyllum pertusum]|uniref:Uncharacterized protein n=1 Tax=Desmophyllum pertusum TaxID=174260 RepID=A0A9W9YU61_9CNID|nr:hypothetical protein OS493_009669 [Desmophyllum pertusum]